MHKITFYTLLISLPIVSMEPNSYSDNDKLPISNYLDLRKSENYQILTAAEKKVISGIENLNPKETSLALIALLNPKLKNDKPKGFIDEKLVSLIESKWCEASELRSLSEISGLGIDFEYLQERKASQAPFLLHTEYTAKQQYQDAYEQERRNSSSEAIRAWKEHKSREDSNVKQFIGTTGLVFGSFLIAPISPVAAVVGLFVATPFTVIHGIYRDVHIKKNQPFPCDPVVYYPARTKNALQNYQSTKKFNLTKFD